MPNVGKSTIINSLRKLGVNKGKVTAVGKTPGITQAIQTRVKIYEDPPIYLVDTPGIYEPTTTSPIEGLKISVVGSTKEKFTTVINVADYLLFRLNNSKLINTYPKVLGLDAPTDDIHKLLGHIASSNGYKILYESRISRLLDDNERKKEGLLDVDRSARDFLDKFREGQFGSITLDDCSKDGLSSWLEKFRYR